MDGLAWEIAKENQWIGKKDLKAIQIGFEGLNLKFENDCLENFNSLILTLLADAKKSIFKLIWHFELNQIIGKKASLVNLCPSLKFIVPIVLKLPQNCTIQTHLIDPININMNLYQFTSRTQINLSFPSSSTCIYFD